jgi:hypothetical protein
MILGEVSSGIVPIVNFTLVGTDNLEEEFATEVDTRLNGVMSLQAFRINRLGFIWTGCEPMRLADGSKSFVNLYRGIVIWNGQPRLVNIAQTESSPLPGTELLLGNRLRSI